MFSKNNNHITLSTYSDGGHTSNYISQSEVNVANEHLKIEKPLLEHSSGMDKFSVSNQYRAVPRHQNYRDGDKLSC